MGKKVLYVSPNAVLGGAEQSLGQWIRLHDRSRWSPIVYFLNDGPLVEEFKKTGTPCFVHSGKRPKLSSPSSVIKAAFQISSVAKAHKIKLIHSVMGYGHIFGGIAAQIARIPEVWYQHGPTGNLDWITGRVPTRALFVNSRYTQNQQAKYRAWTGKISIVYPGTEVPELEAYRKSGELLRESFKVQPHQTLFTLMGRFSAMKGHELFLRAIEKMAKQAPDARFMLVGGPFRKEDEAYQAGIYQLAQELGIQDHVIFTGFLKGSQYIPTSAADVIVNASAVPEPFGLTIVEGMALEKPIIAPKIGGPSEVISHGIDGFLFEPGSAEDLSKHLLTLARSSELRQNLGRKGREKALRQFSIARVVKQLEEEYDQIV